MTHYAYFTVSISHYGHRPVGFRHSARHTLFVQATELFTHAGAIPYQAATIYANRLPHVPEPTNAAM